MKGFSKIESNFIEVSKSSILNFSSTRHQTFENHPRLSRKYLFNIIDLQKKYSSHDPVPCNSCADL
jgi:hypothetical protein